MVFLRPVIVRNAAASDSLTGDRYDYIRNVQGQAKLKSHLFLPDISAPQLPERKINKEVADGVQTGMVKGQKCRIVKCFNSRM